VINIVNEDWVKKVKLVAGFIEEYDEGLITKADCINGIITHLEEKKEIKRGD
jgi:hypothetical protein